MQSCGHAVSVTQIKKKLEIAHHRWQRSIPGISWKDEVTNEKVRQATALPKLEDIIWCRRLRSLGHLSGMDHHRLPRQALTREPEGFRRRPGRPRQNWKDVVEKDLRKMGISWDEVEEDRRSWRNRVAQCVFDVGWTRNQEFIVFTVTLDCGLECLRRWWLRLLPLLHLGLGLSVVQRVCLELTSFS